MALDKRIRDYPLETYIGGEWKKIGNNELQAGKCPICNHSGCFTVYKDTNMWKCFSTACKSNGKGGNIVHLAIMQGKASNVKEAITYLESQIGVSQVKREVKLRTQEAFTSAMHFFMDKLSKSKSAMDYLTETRKRSEYLIEELCYGYTGDGKGIYNHLHGEGFTREEIESTGLVEWTEKQKREKVFEGHIVYFELLNGKPVDIFTKAIDKQQKCIVWQVNKEHKLLRHGFYGYESLKEQTFILVEGQEDRNSILECGNYSVVALRGNPSDEQIYQIKTHAKGKTVYFCFDNDKGGDGYCERIGQALADNNTEIRKINFPLQFKDIDEYLRSIDYDAKEFQHLHDTAPVYGVVVETVDPDYPFDVKDGRSLKKGVTDREVFNFSKVECLHKIEMQDGSTEWIFRFSGQVDGMLNITQSHVNMTTELIKHMVEDFKSTNHKVLRIILTTSDKEKQEVFQQLQRYMNNKIEECKSMGAIRPGIGFVTEPQIDTPFRASANAKNISILNLINVVSARWQDDDVKNEKGEIVKAGKVHYAEVPFQRHYNINDLVYELTEHRNLMNYAGVKNRDKFKGAMDNFIKFYQAEGGKILGFLTACTFYKHLRGIKNLPILYLFAPSQVGKTSTIKVMGSLIGLWTDYAMNRYYVMCALGNTANYIDIAAGGQEQGLHGMCLFFDEVDKDQTGKIEQSIISQYEGMGKGRAEKSGKDISKKQYNSTAVFSSPRLPAQEQYLNRCIVVDLRRIKRKDGDEYAREFNTFLAHRADLSSFLLEVHKNISAEMFMDMFDKLHPVVYEMMGQTKDIRLIDSTTCCMAGYQLLVETKIIPDFMTNNDWIEQATENSEAVKQVSIEQTLLSLALSRVGKHTHEIDWGEYLYVRHHPFARPAYSELYISLENQRAVFLELQKEYSRYHPNLDRLSNHAIQKYFENMKNNVTGGTKKREAWYPRRIEREGFNGRMQKDPYCSYTEVWSENNFIHTPRFLDKNPLNYDAASGAPERVRSNGTKNVMVIKFEGDCGVDTGLPTTESEFDDSGLDNADSSFDTTQMEAI